MTVVCKTCNEKRSNNDCLVYDDYAICCFCLNYYQSYKGKKRPKKLEECDVFTLKLSSAKENHYAFVEWGRAKEQGKLMVVIFDMTYQDKTWKKFSPDLFKYLMNESKNSFKNVSHKIKDAVIKNHKGLNLTSFDEYKDYLKSYQATNKLL